MSAVDELRGAAAEMRRLAEAATPGPRGVDWFGDLEDFQAVHVYELGQHDVASVGGWNVPPPEEEECYDRGTLTAFGDHVWLTSRRAQAVADASHIAAWSPEVALAVADWLEHEIDRIEHDGKYNIFITPGEVRCALKVARAFGRDGVQGGTQSAADGLGGSK